MNDTTSFVTMTYHRCPDVFLEKHALFACADCAPLVYGCCFIPRMESGSILASSPGHSQILSRSCGEKSGEGLVPLLRHRPEMVDSVST